MSTVEDEVDPGRAGLRIAQESFGLANAEITRLPGDVEANFRVTGDRAGGRGTYLLRIFTSGASRAEIAFQRDIVDHAVARDSHLGAMLQQFVRVPGHADDGIARVDFMGSEYGACLQTFIDGHVMADMRPHSPRVLHELGALLGRLNRALADFDGARPGAPASDPSWRVVDAPEVIESRLSALDERPHRRWLVRRILERYERDVAPRLAGLPEGLVHQDANENNVIVDRSLPHPKVAGLIDFGDATHTITCAEPAIAAAYASFGKDDPLAAMAQVVAGYHEHKPLEDDEFEVLFSLSLARLGASVAIAAARMRAGTASDYHLVSQKPAWDALEKLETIDSNLAAATFRSAAGLAALPATSAWKSWATMRSFAPVLGQSIDDAPVVDLSVGSEFLVEGGARDLDAAEWGAKIEALRERSGAPAVIGRYGESRRLYAAAPGFQAGAGGALRTIHLGVDLFAPAGTAVFAPLAGTVHSVQRNGSELDYGPTLVIEHAPEGTQPFWTLYGHLDGEVLDRIEAGDRIARGARIARLGEPKENGGWPPHLHFQVILDRFGFVGDYPGVAAPDDRDVWMAASPDPAGLLGIEESNAGPEDPRQLLNERRERFCSSLSISYDDPLEIVKGRGATLFAADGRAYLDAVNNVPHVGHCHERVVRAGQTQMGMLNTNTRYLNRALHRYADKLRDRLPEHLDVVYFVSSGSEANELALRLARSAAGGSPDVLVQEHGYHGHTGATVARSHYKFAGRGGFEPPEDVHVTPIPDPYRGLHRGARSDEDCGAAYAAEVQRVLDRLQDSGRRPAAFLAEAIIGCGGQVVPPAGYLRRAFEAVRAAGGLAIADEVQVGFGRVGTHFWAFDEQGAVPDIVTMGKPMGNGHPIAAVATTRDIANSFANGMEFFATFGGNNVSIAIGEAVLDVIEDEGLMENALRRGGQFFAAMEEIRADVPCVGDVRGRGLYLGVDLVRDRETREPWPEAARYVANRMRHEGILISTDGPAHNVLKIKPPIVIREDEMARLTRGLGETLRETPLLQQACQR